MRRRIPGASRRPAPPGCASAEAGDSLCMPAQCAALSGLMVAAVTWVITRLAKRLFRGWLRGPRADRQPVRPAPPVQKAE